MVLTRHLNQRPSSRTIGAYRPGDDCTSVLLRSSSPIVGNARNMVQAGDWPGLNMDGHSVLCKPSHSFHGLGASCLHISPLGHLDGWSEGSTIPTRCP